MVNMPVGLSSFPTKVSGASSLVTDENHNINSEYYKWLLQQHDYFPDSIFVKESNQDTIKMEHSYTRNWQSSPQSDVMPTRTILVERAPLCSQCNTCPQNHIEKVDTPEEYNIPVPPYNEDDGNKTMYATRDTIKNWSNHISDIDDWTENINKFRWTEQQKTLFKRIEHILDMDQLGRLSIAGLPNECLRRNAIIEKSASRLRQALASVHWEPHMTQWLHALMVAHLPITEMVSYIDMLRLLKSKVPTLVDKMLYDKPIDMHVAESWEPTMEKKTRVLPGQAIVVVVPSCISKTISTREKQLHEHLKTLSKEELVHIDAEALSKMSTFEEMAMQMVLLTRLRIRTIRNEKPNANIVLVGCKAGAAIALQVAISERVSSVVCVGLAFNTLNGERGAIDDAILHITSPILFVHGQNSQRSSQEEIESLRTKMAAQTLLVIVGSSDDALKVNRLNRVMPGVAQSMIDNMIVDEIHEFVVSCILNPPEPRKPGYLADYKRTNKRQKPSVNNGLPNKRSRIGRSQTKSCAIANDESYAHHNGDSSDKSDNDPHQIIYESSLNGDSSININSIDTNSSNSNQYGIRYGRLDIKNTPVPPSSAIQQKVKLIPSNEFLHLKPPPVNIQQIYKSHNAGGNQSYTLGLNNISSTDIGRNHTKLITITDDRIIQTKPSLRKTETNPNTSNNLSGSDSEASNRTTDSFEYLSTNDYVSESEEMTINDERTTNGRIVTNTFQPFDILSAEIVDDALSQGEIIESQTNLNGIAENGAHDADNAIEQLQDNDYNDGDGIHRQIEMLDDDTGMVEETVETIEATDTIEIVPSPSKYPMNHLNGGEFVLLNGTNQLKNIKYKKFALTGKSSSADIASNTNGRKTIINVNGDKLRLARQTQPIDFNKLSLCVANGQPKRTIQILNGKSRVLEETHRNGYIIKRFSMNGTGENVKLRRLKVVRVNGKNVPPMAKSSNDDERDVDVMGEVEIDNEQQRSAADLISQLEG